MGDGQIREELVILETSAARLTPVDFARASREQHESNGRDSSKTETSIGMRHQATQAERNCPAVVSAAQNADCPVPNRRPTVPRGARRHERKGHNSMRSGHRAAANMDWKKPQCQFVIGIHEDTKFRVVRRLLGSHGANMKAIAEQSGAKLRLRGRGSKFLEGPEKVESNDPLMLCVSAPDRSSYEEAKRLAQSLIEGVYDQYKEFCRSRGKVLVEQVQLNLHEGAREGAR